MWNAYGLNQHDPLIVCNLLGMGRHSITWNTHTQTHTHARAHARPLTHTHLLRALREEKLGLILIFRALVSSTPLSAPLSCACLSASRLLAFLYGFHLWPAEAFRKSRKTDVFKATEASREAWSPEARSSAQDRERRKHKNSKHPYILIVLLHWPKDHSS